MLAPVTRWCNRPLNVWLCAAPLGPNLAKSSPRKRVARNQQLLRQGTTMRLSYIRLTALCGAAFLAIGCQEASAPTASSVGMPRISAALAPVAPGSAIVLDQQTGTLNESGTELAKGFNLPNANPHLG